GGAAALVAGDDPAPHLARPPAAAVGHERVGGGRVVAPLERPAAPRRVTQRELARALPGVELAGAGEELVAQGLGRDLVQPDLVGEAIDDGGAVGLGLGAD